MNRRNIYFNTVIFFIIILGLIIRLLHYDFLPGFNETADEFMYPWAGMSLLQTGVPTSWSGITSYKNKKAVYYWDKKYIIVTPWVHKPLLYPIISGGIMMISGATQFDEVRISKLRLIPITLSILTILLIAIYCSLSFNRQIAIAASLLYATIPTIVISNRLSLIENAMIPLVMMALILLAPSQKYMPAKYHPYLLGIIGGIAILLKQTGVFIPLAGIIYYLTQKRFKESLIVAMISLIGLSLYIGPGIGYVDLAEFVRLNMSFNDYHSGGLPQLVNTMFRFPIITNHRSLFIDPFILAGYLLLFSAPWWLKKLKNKKSLLNDHLLLIFPFSYLLIMVIAETGNAHIYGWHFFPLFPFISILLGIMWYKLYTKGTFLQIFSAFLVLSSMIAWLITIASPLKPYWQIIMVISAILILIIARAKTTIRSASMIVILLAFVLINILIVYQAPNMLPTSKQPLSPNQVSAETQTVINR